jgi:hypothetical protein
MKRNMEKFGGLVFSEHVMLALVSKGLSREQAYKLVQRNAARVWDERVPFLNALLGDPEVRRYLTEDELRQCLSLEHHLRYLHTTVERVLGNAGTLTPHAHAAPTLPDSDGVLQIGGVGKTHTKVVPCPSSDCTKIVPLCFSTARRTSISPIPLPCWRVVTARSKRWSRTSGGIPGPVSRMTRIVCSGCSTQSYSMRRSPCQSRIA